MVQGVQRECIFQKAVFIGFRDFAYFVPNIVESESVDNPLSKVMGGWGIWETVNGEQRLTTECIENVIMMVPFSAVVMWTFQKKAGNGWKNIVWQSGMVAFIFSIVIEVLQLLLRLGTFQLSDIFYNTVGGVVGGVCYWGVMRVRKKL